jgi:hypothetical protein
LLTILPESTDTEYSQDILDDIRELRQAVLEAKHLWAQATQVVGFSIVDGFIQDNMEAS